MNILVLGSGGREHALTWKLKQSPQITKIFVAPGNAGTSQIAINVDIDLNNFEAIKNIVRQQRIDLIVVGPEAPLAKGIVDYFSQDNVFVFGPNKQAAKLESSKAFAKKFMQKYNIPTAKFQTFQETQLHQAIDFLKQLSPPYVIKASGLAAGKGVSIINSFDEAVEEIKQMFQGKFGSASKTIVIEQFLKGIELSVFIITDGNSYKILPTAKDYKRIGEGDTGPNTGGMGAISPMPIVDENIMYKIENQIIKPTIQGLKQEGILYQGFLYFGLMLVDSQPYVLEYNVRLGDPEAQTILPRLKTDLLQLILATKEQKLDNINIEIIPQFSATVILASKGYPLKYEKGKTIENLDKISECLIFHAGTKFKDNKIVTSGGRVLAITALADSLEKALSKAYKAAEIINFENKYYRKDIGYEFI